MLIIFAAMVCASCASEDHSQTHAAGDYSVTVTTEPAPPKVGEDAMVTASVAKNNKGVEGCHLLYRQYMLDHEMSTDRNWIDMGAVSGGSYRARSGQFTMGGDWELEFQLNCNGTANTVKFSYHLEWMT